MSNLMMLGMCKGVLSVFRLPSMSKMAAAPGSYLPALIVNAWFSKVAYV